MSSANFDKIVAECRKRIKNKRVIGGGGAKGHVTTNDVHKFFRFSDPLSAFGPAP